MHGVHGATATAAASAVPLYTFSPGVNLLGWTHTTHHLPLAQRGGVRKPHYVRVARPRLVDLAHADGAEGITSAPSARAAHRRN